MVTFTVRPTTWFAKLAFGFVALALAVLAFFFLTVALITGALVALAFLGRLWWISRKLRREREETAIEGEFTVVEHRESTRRINDKA